MTPDPEPTTSARVAAYLDQIIAPLTRSLPGPRQGELRRELRAHLLERIASYQEQGMAEDKAVTETLQQFGGAEDFLEQWQQRWAAAGPLTLRGIYKAGKSALKPSLQGIAGVNLLYLVAQECIWQFPHSAAIAFINRHSEAAGLSLAVSSFLLVPVAVGARYGRRTPERAGLGMAAALLAQIAVVSLIYGAAALLLDNGQAVGITVTDMLFNGLLALLAVWIPVAGGAAAVSSRRTQRGQNHRLA